MFLVVLSTLIVTLWCVVQFGFGPPSVAEPSPPDQSVSPEGAADPQAAPAPALERKGDWYQTFLLVGTDDGNGNADTIMVASFDTKNHKVGVISIPRDTLVDEPRRVKKINGAYGAGGVEELHREVSELVGFRVDHTIRVDIAAFREMVDELGGVSFYVPCDMYHNDGAGFIINLKEGTQWLDGEKALQLVRYRGYPNADLGRIQTQQKFLGEMAKQLLKVSNLGKINRFAEIFDRNVETDLSLPDLIYFGTRALEVNFSEDVTFATLPGDGQVHHNGVKYYYQLFPQETLDMLNRLVNPYTADLTLEMTEIYQVQ